MIDFASAYTENEALAKREAYLYLLGKDYMDKNEKWGIIKDIAVVPFEKLNRYIFAWFYSYYADAAKSLNFYQAPHFDLLIIALSNDNQQFGFRSLDTYLDGQRLPMDMILENKQFLQ